MKSVLFVIMLLISAYPSWAQDPFAQSGSAPSEQMATADSAGFLPVDQAYQSLLSWDDDTLLLQWTITSGYYLYKERFAISAELNGDALSPSIRFEPGKIKDDPYFGRTEVFYYNTNLSISGLPKDQPFVLTVRSQGCADAGLCYPPQIQRYQYKPQSHEFVQADATGSTATAPAKVISTEQNSAPSLAWVITFAILGGAILNLMPCVFPVLSLKVLSFSQAEDGKTSSHGVIYSLGVIISFIVVAAVLIGLQQAGQAVGWGFQLQQPGFVAVMASLFFVLSLNLLGYFEIAGRWMNTGSSLSQERGHSGSFFTGVLATLVASPCTAPFMGTAVGYAATQPPAIALLVFASLGAGMALPVLLLSLFPGWLEALPKPGAWMERLRQLLAFPLLASAIWLLWVYGRQLGANSMATLLIAWLLIAFALWLWKLGSKGKILSIISLLLAVYTAMAGNHLSDNPQTSGQFDPAQIEKMRAAGSNVFLDVTADWCITCKANEKLVLHTPEIEQAFKDNNVHYLVADWTRYDPAITTLLAQYERNGIPLYIYYSADPKQAVQILPQILSKSLVLKLFES